MSILPFIPAKPPMRRQRKSPPVPVTTNRIVSIVLRPDALGYIVEVSNPMTSYTFEIDTWFFTVDGGEETPMVLLMVDPLHLDIEIAGDATNTTAWTLTDGSGFEFANGEPLTGPMGGGFPYP